MTIIAARRYRNGQIVECELLPGRSTPVEREFDWIGLVEPSADEMQLVQTEYNLHPLAVEDALSQPQGSKAEAYGSQLFVVACTAAPGEGDKIAYGQTAIFLGTNFIITVRQGSTRAHLDLREELEAKPDHLEAGADFVLHAVLDFIVDGYGTLLDWFEAKVTILEEGAIGAFPDQARIRRIFRLRKTLREFEGIAGQMVETGLKLAEVTQPAIDPLAQPFFRDVYDHARRAVTRARQLRDALGSIVEVAGMLERHRQGSIIRQLAAWAAILAVPTAVAGIYGMNFEFMPELGWPYGYFALLGAIATICGLLFWRFKRIGWL